MRRMPLTVVVN